MSTAISTMVRRHRRRRVPVGSIICAVVLLVVFLLPLLYLLNTAIKSNAEFFSSPGSLVHHPMWGNFFHAWQQGGFGHYLLNSVLYTAAGAGMGTLLAFLLGFPVARGYLKWLIPIEGVVGV
ncbi:multiple sugar transport system permease protein/raffinose/stachyose/melibiose transport system permease protein [Propionibacterium cyclohexanicum]|uniref:Multiple sugar transport system permease protein/raffinose/stachyose/melibiose transport system permease protein n=1 Tax=Propionibacterium cyclohexanicum TaxID=64702 RepID=A0A1H9TC45_9ACTN|nr:multiple sugar transport system permease protein/raffinose/stachyose/melibiose transport system permease protein [Propionibacterium cyclohexanicum]